MTNINFRIDETTKKQAMQLFDELGIDMSTALTMFLKQAIRDGALPFTPNIDSMRKAGITVIETKEQLMQAIEEGKEDVKCGRVRPAEDVMKDIRNKHGL